MPLCWHKGACNMLQPLNDVEILRHVCPGETVFSSPFHFQHQKHFIRWPWKTWKLMSQPIKITFLLDIWWFFRHIQKRKLRKSVHFFYEKTKVPKVLTQFSCIFVSRTLPKLLDAKPRWPQLEWWVKTKGLSPESSWSPPPLPVTAVQWDRFSVDALSGSWNANCELQIEENKTDEVDGGLW